VVGDEVERPVERALREWMEPAGGEWVGVRRWEMFGLRGSQWIGVEAKGEQGWT
jgi:hypothetical protein